MVEMGDFSQTIRRRDDQDLMDAVQVVKPFEGAQLIAGIAKFELGGHDGKQDREQGSVRVH